jgi:hypothetical protein
MLGHPDVVNGAYYVFMWFETRAAGTGVLALRFPSAVGMAVAAGVTAALGRRLVSARAGLAVGLVFAALPSVTVFCVPAVALLAGPAWPRSAGPAAPPAWPSSCWSRCPGRSGTAARAATARTSVS